MLRDAIGPHAPQGRAILLPGSNVSPLNSLVRKGATYARQTRRPWPAAASRIAGTSALENSRPPRLHRDRRHAARDSHLVSLEWKRLRYGYATQGAQVEGSCQKSQSFATHRRKTFSAQGPVDSRDRPPRAGQRNRPRIRHRRGALLRARPGQGVGRATWKNDLVHGSRHHPPGLGRPAGFSNTLSKRSPSVTLSATGLHSDARKLEHPKPCGAKSLLIRGFPFPRMALALHAPHAGKRKVISKDI